LGGELGHVDVPATSNLDLEGGELPLAALPHDAEGAETEQWSDLLGRGELRRHLGEVWKPAITNDRPAAPADEARRRVERARSLERLAALYFEACGFRPTRAGLLHLIDLS
jgi:hypothetical protein